MTTQPPSEPPPPQGSPTPDPTDVDKNKVFAILAYICFLIPLLATKDSPYARYHTNQGVCLFIAAICVFFPLAIFSLIPFIGHLAGCFLFPLVLLVYFVFMIVGVLNAAAGKQVSLPVIGEYTLIK